MKKTINDSKKRQGKKVLTPEQKQARKIQEAKRREIRTHQNEIRKILTNIGYERVYGVAGINFTYNNIRSELDDVFVCENVILLIEYTTDKRPGDHLKGKSIFYNEVNANPINFIKFLITEKSVDGFRQFYEKSIQTKYPQLEHLQLRILYCSRQDIDPYYKGIVNSINYLDYNIVQYFKLLTKVIKKTARYEFLNFIGIDHSNYADNVIKSTLTTMQYRGYILPESKSSFKNGYKIISFYIDAESLMRRAYVLRRESWRQEESIRLYQRMLDNGKISRMRKYLYDENRVFINNIIATISTNDISLKTVLKDNKSNKYIEIPINIDDNGDFGSSASPHIENVIIEINDKYNIIGIIDGQHRVYAYHEGSDMYEEKISQMRRRQNLLVSCIIYPKNENEFEKNRFEANLFLEINKNQKKLGSTIQQDIELIVSPFSTIAIGKDIIKRLNENGPLQGKLTQTSYDKHKISTASIVSYGLRPLIKMDELAEDSLFRIWDNPQKLSLKDKNCKDDNLRNEYIEFCTSKIRDLLIAYKENLEIGKLWEPYSALNKNGILGVVLINGILNVLRLLITNDNVSTSDIYALKLKDISKFPFRAYTSSQYRKMGEEMYKKYFMN